MILQYYAISKRGIWNKPSLHTFGWPGGYDEKSNFTLPLSKASWLCVIAGGYRYPQISQGVNFFLIIGGSQTFKKRHVEFPFWIQAEGWFFPLRMHVPWRSWPVSLMNSAPWQHSQKRCHLHLIQMVKRFLRMCCCTMVMWVFQRDAVRAHIPLYLYVYMCHPARQHESFTMRAPFQEVIYFSLVWRTWSFYTLCVLPVKFDESTMVYLLSTVSCLAVTFSGFMTTSYNPMIPRNSAGHDIMFNWGILQDIMAQLFSAEDTVLHHLHCVSTLRCVRYSVQIDSILFPYEYTWKLFKIYLYLDSCRFPLHTVPL